MHYPELFNLHRRDVLHGEAFQRLTLLWFNRRSCGLYTPATSQGEKGVLVDCGMSPFVMGSIYTANVCLCILQRLGTCGEISHMLPTTRSHTRNHLNRARTKILGKMASVWAIQFVSIQCLSSLISVTSHFARSSLWFFHAFWTIRANVPHPTMKTMQKTRTTPGSCAAQLSRFTSPLPEAVLSANCERLMAGIEKVQWPSHQVTGLKW